LSSLLAACNRLRGPVDPTDYKAYIFPLLFLKRISDYWDWEYARALEAFDGEEKLARLEDNFRFVLPEGCHWADVQALTENVGVELQKILQRIELCLLLVDKAPDRFGRAALRWHGATAVRSATATSPRAGRFSQRPRHWPASGNETRPSRWPELL
jgi:hypothetical protein